MNELNDNKAEVRRGRSVDKYSDFLCLMCIAVHGVPTNPSPSTPLEGSARFESPVNSLKSSDSAL